MSPRKQPALEALCVKYRTLRALRLAAASAPEAPRAQLAALAARHPGALRELDQLPMALIEARLAAIERVLCAGDEPETWMRLQVAYHGFMRAVLRIRRLSRARPSVIEDVRRELEALPYVPEEDEPPASRFDLHALQIIRRPPGGRLNPWVLEQVARDHDVSADVVSRALFVR